MAIESVFVWNGRSDTIYREARRQITARTKTAPRTVKELDFADFFQNSKDKLVYFPVFQDSAGWWGPLLGTNAKIKSKMIVSPECQLYEIGMTGEDARGAETNQLFAAEIPPKPKLFRKIREIPATIRDMIATDNGTILTLLSANNENKIKGCIKTLGGEFFGNLGGY